MILMRDRKLFLKVEQGGESELINRLRNAELFRQYKK